MERGRCKLCLAEDVELRHSHILPEFLYAGVYDEKHRTIGVDPRPDSKNRFLQKGLRESLLCGDCEALLAELERYASEVLRGLPSTEGCKPGDLVWTHGIDYRKFKLFQMSLLWRCSIATQPTFAAVDLGPHEDKVRRMLLEGDPGEPWEYGCVLAALQKPGSVEGMVKFPGKLRLDGHIAYHMVVWGLLWFFVVSGHAYKLKGQGSFLSKSGDLPIHITSRSAEDFVAGVARQLAKGGKKL